MRKNDDWNWIAFEGLPPLGEEVLLALIDIHTGEFSVTPGRREEDRWVDIGCHELELEEFYVPIGWSPYPKLANAD